MKKIIYVVLGIGAIAGFYFFSKNKKSSSDVITNLPNKPIEPSLPNKPTETNVPNTPTNNDSPVKPVLNQLHPYNDKYPQKINNLQQTYVKGQGSYDESIIAKNTVIEDVKIVNSAIDFFGSFMTNKLNSFDGGGGIIPSYKFDILKVVDNSYRQKVTPIYDKNGFKVGGGDIVNIRINQDIKRSFPNKVIFYT